MTRPQDLHRSSHWRLQTSTSRLYEALYKNGVLTFKFTSSHLRYRLSLSIYTALQHWKGVLGLAALNTHIDDEYGAAISLTLWSAVRKLLVANSPRALPLEEVVQLAIAYPPGPGPHTRAHAVGVLDPDVCSTRTSGRNLFRCGLAPLHRRPRAPSYGPPFPLPVPRCPSSIAQSDAAASVHPIGNPPRGWGDEWGVVIGLAIRASVARLLALAPVLGPPVLLLVRVCMGRVLDIRRRGVPEGLGAGAVACGLR
ncbi:hypothetical protein B0H14DRAFT_3476400 [Mycena olivaceomarginata]|nr:hypothetical protein B0H14DRAFT_3476400 [Mycena olivaceomarginata]